MIVIKKITVFILVLVLVLSLSISCFAVGDEPTGDDEPSGGSSVDTSSLQDMFDDIGDKIDNLNLNIVNLIGDDNYTLLNKPIDEYSVIEGFLFLIFIVVFIRLLFYIFRR